MPITSIAHYVVSRDLNDEIARIPWWDPLNRVQYVWVCETPASIRSLINFGKGKFGNSADLFADFGLVVLLSCSWDFYVFLEGKRVQKY